MENENTVEEMQDNNAIKQMRERIKEIESAEKELNSVKMANAIKDAGFDPDNGAGKALKDLYKGELQADAIKEFASQYGWGDAPAEPTQEELQRQRVVSSQANLDTVIEASVPVEPVGLDDQIAQAQADGDWATSSALKADKLKALLKDK
jgi:heterodisulfide reductase subunit A-like polyferredoxin